MWSDNQTQLYNVDFSRGLRKTLEKYYITAEFFIIIILFFYTDPPGLQTKKNILFFPPWKNTFSFTNVILL